jgi:hypothetical protein
MPAEKILSNGKMKMGSLTLTKCLLMLPCLSKNKTAVVPHLPYSPYDFLLLNMKLKIKGKTFNDVLKTSKIHSRY